MIRARWCFRTDDGRELLRYGSKRAAATDIAWLLGLPYARVYANLKRESLRGKAP